MPIPSPFHERTAALCESLRWKDWGGYYAVCRHTAYMEREYFAFRHAAGLIDVTPLCKYEVRGKDAAAFLSRIMVRDVTQLKPEQVAYTCWCDDDGKIVDDGTVWRIADEWYRVTSSEPTVYWLKRFAAGLDVTIADVTDKIAAVSIQGPNSREILKQITDADLDTLRFFRLTRGRVAGFDVMITRTGYTGDLGYEVWVANEHAVALWDAIFEAGKPHGLAACGLDALDVTRIEAGFIMASVDYHSATHCLIDARKSTPYELDLGWMVHLDREPFNGQAALRRERERGSAKKLVCIELDWDHYERLFAEHGLPPEVCTDAWRSDVPVVDLFGRAIGYANSGAWSPSCKKHLALAHVHPDFADQRTEVKFEVTVEHRRRKCRARVGPKPALSLPRARAIVEKESPDGADGRK